MRFLWSRVECEAAVGSNVRSVPGISFRTLPVLCRSQLFNLLRGEERALDALLVGLADTDERVRQQARPLGCGLSLQWFAESVFTGPRTWGDESAMHSGMV